MKFFKAFPGVVGWRILLFVMPLIACTVQRNLDELFNAESARTIYEPGGEIPAAKAIVKVFNGGGEPVAVYSTDENGRYSLTGLSEGMYTIWAEKDSFVLLQSSVVVTAAQTTLQDDTLECPSTLTGIVGLQNYHDPRSVTVQVKGIDRLPVFADGEGKFTVTGLASGTWTISFQSTILEYLPTDQKVEIPVCSNATITDTFRLYFSGIPIVSGIKFSQDTLEGTMKLSWKKPPYKIIRDYLIFRDSCKGIVYSKEPASITEDTMCIDSIYFPLVADSLDTVERCLLYRIAIRNTVPVIGAFCSSMEVPFAPKSSATTFFAHRVGYASDTNVSASINDTVTVFLTAKNRTRPLRRLYWYDPIKHDTIATREAIDAHPKNFIDSIRYAFHATGIQRLVAIVIDDAGVKWFDTVSVNIVSNTLTAMASVKDSIVYSCDTIYLHGKAESQFGEIAQWEWKIGPNGWNRTSGPDTAIAAIAFTTTVPCSLAVTDQDGQRIVSGVKIYVIAVPDIKIVKIAAGGYHDLLLDDKAILRARGTNNSGQLGVQTVFGWLSWTTMMTDVQSMDAGDSFSLVLKTDGTLWSCGSNQNGQLGDGTTTTRYDPVKILSDVQSIAAGANHSLFLKTDGTLWACGSNQYGQLGDGSTTDRLLPVLVMTDVFRMSAGGSHSLILKTDGTLWTCGANMFGQLGDGTKENRLFPVKVLTEVRNMDAGVAHSLILKTDGTLWACGLNFAGQLGDNTTENRLTPVRVMTDVEEAAAGQYHSVILKTDRTVWSFGDNGMGQLGDSTGTCRLTPVKTMGNVKNVVAGGSHTLILQDNGTLWICGWISYNADSYGGTSISSIPVRLIPE
jgi:hypothetical protein